MTYLIQSVDFSILNFIQEHFQCGFLNWLMPKITFLGDRGLIWILIGIIMLFFRKSRKYGIIMLISLTLGALIGNVCLKNLVARSRPCWIDSAHNMLIDVPKDFSFPSGHTIASTVGAAVTFYANKRLGIAAIVLAALIAFSRLYLYVHFPTDILAGALIGLFCALLVIFVAKKFSDRKPKKQSNIK